MILFSFSIWNIVIHIVIWITFIFLLKNQLYCDYCLFDCNEFLFLASFKCFSLSFTFIVLLWYVSILFSCNFIAWIYVLFWICRLRFLSSLKYTQFSYLQTLLLTHFSTVLILEPPNIQTFNFPQILILTIILKERLFK